MSRAKRESEVNTPPRTWPAPRVGTEFTRDESNDHWFLCYLYPGGDVPGDPAGWPDWSDADRWQLGPDVPQRAVPDCPSETDYPF
jgi:hypothetical protein